MHLNKDLPNHSRVWVYQSKTSLHKHEAYINSELGQFVNSWESHGKPVSGDFEVVLGHFIVIAADENVLKVSGCSVDSLVSVINSIGQQIGHDLFERQTIFYSKNGVLQSSLFSNLDQLVQEESIGEQTLMVNTLVKTLDEYKNNWLTPFELSWHKRMIV